MPDTKKSKKPKGEGSGPPHYEDKPDKSAGEGADRSGEATPPTPDGSSEDAPSGGAVGLPGGFAASMPEVQPHAIRAHREAVQESAPSEGERDKSGNVFDPENHAVGPDGKGVKTQAGNWAKKRGRKNGQSPAPGRVGGKPREKSPDEVKREKAQALGTFAAASLINLGVGFGGEEWHPIKDEGQGIDERANLTSAFGDYFHASGMEDFPPGVALAIAVGAYAMPRFAAPKTRSKLGRLKDWLSEKFLKLRRKRAESKEKSLAGRNHENEDGARNE